MKLSRQGWALPILVASSLCAAAHAAEVSPILKGGIDVGGDTVATVAFVGGESERIRANEGLYVGGGVSIINQARNVELELSIAYKARFIRADNGDVDWTRVPLEALVFYRFPKVRLGGGLTLHLDPKLQGDGVVGGLDVRFDDARGVVLQLDYLFTDKFSVGMRYTNVKYEVKGASGVSFTGDGIGVNAALRF